MTQEELNNIIKLQSELKDLSNSKLIEIMESLTTEFDLTKENLIKLTFYLDTLENLYNKTFKEYETRVK